jgi:thioredoxin 1
MATGPVIELTEGNFSAEVTQAKVPVLVDFWAEWCGPCKMIAPLLAELASESQGQFKVAKVNVDDHRNLAAQYNVQSLPTLLLFKDGQVKDTVIGAGTPKAILRKKLEALA